MLISVGIAHTLRCQPTLGIRIWDRSERSAQLSGTERVDVVLADSRCLRLLRWNDAATDLIARPMPQLIWITQDADSEGNATEPPGLSARLPVDCREHDLIEIMQRLDFVRILKPCQPLRPAHIGGLAPGAMRRAIDHIATHLAERVQLIDLARMAGLSECHFARAFKQSTGLPPHRYLLNRRIAVAADLIARTDRALSDIALEVGFCDQSHFTRQFSSALGTTPSDYRRQRR